MAGQEGSVGVRRLGAIMFTDVVGYSAASSQDEARALKMLEEHRKILEEVFPKYGGTVVKTIGDGYLVEFLSAVEAVNCAVQAQNKLSEFNSGRSEKDRISVRIGIHVGDVVHSGGDVLGDAVNVAARVQPLAEPGGISVTRQVVDQVQRKVDQKMISIGVRDLKNIQYPVEIFRVELAKGVSGTIGQSLDPRRVAVLPFTNMSPDPNDRYFADGMTEEVISTVSKISELQVISRTSVMRYRDSTAPLSQIGQELAVGSVLEGSVRKAGNKVRITAQLIAVDSDKHVWSQSYDRDLNDVFAIQADIAEQVAGSLKVQLLSRERDSIRKESTSSPDAYTLYLKGRFYWHERTEEGTRKALSYFQKASELDPGFAIVYSGISDAYSILSDYGWMAPSEAIPKAQLNASKALSIDENLAEAHASLGLALSNSWDLDGGVREFKRAMEIKPNYGPAQHWYAVNAFYMRRYDESVAAMEHALSLDPYSRVYNMVLANAKLIAYGRYHEVLKRYDELIEAHPDMSALRYWRATCYLLAGMNQEAIKEAEEYIKMEGGSWASNYSNLFLAWVYASSGRMEDAGRIIRMAVEKSKAESVSSTGVGWVKVLLGEEEGYAWLARAFDEHDPALLYFNGFPWTKQVRMDTRWKAIESKFPFRSVPD